ncbi:hypothetical protein K1719_025684 [Acacia pycnantha]|nr:hypothetical protein K1719_025684 [Acacia pycnantha]
MKSTSNKEDRGGAAIPRLLKLEHGRTWVSLRHVSAQAPPSRDQLMEAPTVTYDNKTMAIIMGMVVIVFFVSGFVSLYSRQCGNRRRSRGHIDLTFPMGLPGSGSRTQGRGVSSEIIQSFPTFVYSTVKVRRGALACAVCLNEYEDDETLRLIPKCSHVFHPECIDGWLKSHYTCPLCRANLLVPVAAQSESEETPLVPIEASDSEEEGESDNGGVIRGNIRMNRSRTVKEERGPSRSRSTGFVMGILFGRSRSTGDGYGRDNWERYTLRWEEVKRERRLKRTKSCVTFTGMSSGRRGYRTRSVGSSHSHSHFAYDRFITSHTFPFNPATTPSSSL